MQSSGDRLVVRPGAELMYELNDYTNWPFFLRRLKPTILVWGDHFLWTFVNFVTMGVLLLCSVGLYLYDWWRLGRLPQLADGGLIGLPGTVRQSLLNLAAAAWHYGKQVLCQAATLANTACRIRLAAVVTVFKNWTRKWPPAGRHCRQRHPLSAVDVETPPLSAVNVETPNIHATYCSQRLDLPDNDFTSVNLRNRKFDLNNAIFFLHLSALVYEDQKTLEAFLKQWHLTWAAVVANDGDTCSAAWVVHHSSRMCAAGRCCRPNQDFIAVVFKGTSPCDCVDWLTDLTMAKTKPHGESLPGMVHEGFVKMFEWPWYKKPIVGELQSPTCENATEGIVCDPVQIAQRLGKDGGGEFDNFRPPLTFYELLIREINRTVRTMFVDKGTEAALWITGHSLGAALASIFFAHLLHVPELPVIIPSRTWLKGGYTFGAPRTGDVRYAAEVRRHPETRNFYDIVNANDPVTWVPVAQNVRQDDRALTNFSHIGNEVLLNYWGTHTQVDEPWRWTIPVEERIVLTCANFCCRLLSLPCYLLRAEIPRIATVLRCLLYFAPPLAWSVFDHLPSEYLRHLEDCKNGRQTTTTPSPHVSGSAAHD